MQKLIPIIVVVVVSLALWFAITSRGKKTSEPANATSTSVQVAGNSSTTETGSNSQTQAATNSQNGVAPSNHGASDDQDSTSEDFDDRPATERYKTAEEALKAIKDAAVDYDDLVLDQFTLPGENCSWCDSVYASVKDLMLSPDTKADQRSFYAEILAVSGKVENLKTLVDGIKAAKNQDEIDSLSEALELSVGKEDVVKFLGDELAESNQTIKESSVAALTNQGSRLAVETLFNHTVSQGNPDGYYQLGIGVGEMVPDEDAWPYLQQKALQKDAYSNLAAKALLNVGLEGVKMVADLYGNSDDPEFAKKVLESSKDHVAFDDETIEYLKSQSTSTKSPILADWYKSLLKEYEQSEQEIANAGDSPEEDEGEPFTPVNPAQ